MPLTLTRTTGQKSIEGKSAMGRGDITSTETYGTSRANAYKILEDTLNLKDVRIYDAIEDEEGRPKRVLNKTDTMLAQQKQQVIKDAFANWIWQDPQRRIALVKQYNELFNSNRPREYDGSHIHFVGMNPEISLREHQRNAIAHVLYGGNTLLAHEVGAGKTFEMAASAMEAKRLLHDKPKDFAAFLDSLEQQGYEVKRGKHPSVKGKGQRRFIRFRTLGAGYTEEEIKTVLDGKAEHQPPPKQPLPEKKFGLLVDIPTKMAEGKTSGYKKWATRFNLKEMSKTLLYLQEKKIDSADELRERAAAATERYHTLGDSIKAAEKRMGEIAVLRAHIVNYAKTRDAYAAYRKAGYSKKFLEAHREEIELHKAAKAAFDEADLKKLPKVKDLNVEYSELLSQKKAAYPEYRKAKEEMQELVRAQKNVERFFAEEKQTHETEQVR